MLHMKTCEEKLSIEQVCHLLINDILGHQVSFHQVSIRLQKTLITDVDNVIIV